MHNPESDKENETHKLLKDLAQTNLGQTTRFRDTQQKKKRTCRIVDFAVPADRRVKLKQSEKKNSQMSKIILFISLQTWIVNNYATQGTFVKLDVSYHSQGTVGSGQRSSNLVIMLPGLLRGRKNPLSNC